MARVVEIKPKVPNYPPRREFKVFLAPYESRWKGDKVLELPGIPKQGESHQAASPICVVSCRCAVRLGPCRFAVYIHYRSLEPDTQERPHVIRGPEPVEDTD